MQLDNFSPRITGQCYKERKKESDLRYRIKNQEKIKNHKKECYYKRKMIVYNHYCNGNIKCNICGKINIKYLTIDHINGGGRKHTKEIGIVLVKWIIDNNFPPGFQILCMNCQWKKAIENKEFNWSK